MAKTLAQLQKQISALEQKADALKRKEAEGVIARIKEAIAHYGLTAADLGLAGAKRGPKPGSKPGRKNATAKKKPAAKAKYSDDQGHSWTGHGRRPQWFVAALAAGKKPEELLA